jgi:hypothetical protein
MRESAIAAGTLGAVMLALGGCAIRYDQTGVSRVGVFLWGLGDPPGVHWNLDAPRREIRDLPAAPRPELPAPRSTVVPSSPNQSAADRLGSPMEDNRDCVFRCAPEPNAAGMARHADDRGDDTVRR